MDEHFVEVTLEQLKTSPVGQWVQVRERGHTFFNICGKSCMIGLVREATNDRRGCWHGKIDTWGEKGVDLNKNWGDSRYYFQHDRARREIEDWLATNEQI